MTYKVTVRDVYCGVKDVYLEEWDCATKEEAQNWVKQFKQEYSKDDGYKIELKEIN